MNEGMNGCKTTSYDHAQIKPEYVFTVLIRDKRTQCTPVESIRIEVPKSKLPMFIDSVSHDYDIRIES
jgi:hypothetical protein